MIFLLALYAASKLQAYKLLHGALRWRESLEMLDIALAVNHDHTIGSLRVVGDLRRKLAVALIQIHLVSRRLYAEVRRSGLMQIEGVTGELI